MIGSFLSLALLFYSGFFSQKLTAWHGLYSDIFQFEDTFCVFEESLGDKLQLLNVFLELFTECKLTFTK
jgi:hypothetical protein